MRAFALAIFVVFLAGCSQPSAKEQFGRCSAKAERYFSAHPDRKEPPLIENFYAKCMGDKGYILDRSLATCQRPVRKVEEIGGCYRQDRSSGFQIRTLPNIVIRITLKFSMLSFMFSLPPPG